jgi:NADH:ubiquinone oxidoreductase subunit F (NADH-binding)
MQAVAEAVTGRARLLSAARGSIVVANGVESEPVSGKDTMLLGLSPHLVLDGIAVAAAAVGASRAYLCVHSGRPELVGLLKLAVTERERAGLSRVPIQVAEVPGGYLASQETALVSFLNGGPQRPTFVPPRPAEKGVQGRPTLVQNVETLAHLALIARYGAAWFRSAGRARCPGSALVTVSGAVRQPSVVEAEFGTRIGELLDRAGGPGGRPQAVLAGGYFGGWLPCPAALDIRLSDADLHAAGAALGPGILVVLPEAACGLAETARAVSYLASQSAGQCGPCRNGLPALAAAFDRVAFGLPDEEAMGWARQLLTLVAGRGACHLPDGTAALAASALRVFGPDLRRHAAAGPCPGAGRPPVLPLPQGWPR